MDCSSFRSSLLRHLDGELPAAEAGAAQAHERACPDCAERAGAERAFEARVTVALLGASPAGATDGLVAGAMRREPAGRVVRPARWIRRFAVAAAVLFVLVEGAWFFCIPPFECAVLQAVERVAEDDGGSPLAEAVPATDRLRRVAPPAVLAGLDLIAPPRVVDLGPDAPRAAVRACYGCDCCNPVTAVWCDPAGHEPSFRRKVERAGRTWWVAEEHGRRMVAWMCPKTGTLCTLVGDRPEEELLGLAERVREGAP